MKSTTKQLSSELREFSYPFLKKFGLKEAWINRFCFDGSFYSIQTDYELNMLMLNDGWVNSLACDLISPLVCGKNSDFVFHWNYVTPNAEGFLSKVHAAKKVQTGLSLIVETDQFVDNIGFNSDLDTNTFQQLLITHEREFAYYLLAFRHFHQDKSPSFSAEQKLADGWHLTVPSSSSKASLYQEKIPLSIIGINGKISLRQAEVLVQLAMGKCFKETARTLGISPRTVKFHVNDIRVIYHNISLGAIIQELHKSSNFQLLKMLV